MFGVRLAGLLTDMTAAQVATIDLISNTALGGLLAALVLPTLFSLLPFCAGSVALAIYRPEYAPILAESVIPGTALVAIALWNRASVRGHR
jgi:hypothetical protein